MNTKTFDIARNRLADCFLLLIEASEKNTPSSAASAKTLTPQGAEASQPIIVNRRVDSTISRRTEQEGK